MPNRILRDKIIKSDRVNRLSWAAEVFYRRLMSIVDDFGRYDARPGLLRTDLFGLRIDKVPESDIVKWMDECSNAGLVRFYDVDNKPFLEILQFNQTIRVKKSKYPAPGDTSAMQMHADATQMISYDTQMTGTCVSGGRNQSGSGIGDGDGVGLPPPQDLGFVNPVTSISLLTNEENKVLALRDNDFRAGAYRQGITDPSKLSLLLDRLNRERSEVGKNTTNIQEYRKHFFNWLRKGCHLNPEVTTHEQPKSGLSEAERQAELFRQKADARRR